jgi:hypothetical protein
MSGPLQQAVNDASADTLNVSITSAGSTLLVAIGQLYAGSGPNCWPTSVTDTAGNDWQFSTSLSESPPSASVPGQTPVLFISWAIDAVAVTSITFGSTDAVFMSINVSEWPGSWSVSDAGYLQNSTNAELTAPALAVPANALVIGGVYPSSGGGLSPGMQPPAATALTAPQSGNDLWFMYQEFLSATTLDWDWQFMDTPCAQVAVAFGPAADPKSGLLMAGMP